MIEVFASIRLPDPIRPATEQSAIEVIGAGVILDGEAILTGAAA